MIAELKRGLDPLLGARVGSWEAPEASPPQEVQEVLLESLRAEELWFPLLVIYALDSVPEQWKRRLEMLKTMRRLWREAWWEQGCPSTLEGFDYAGICTNASRRKSFTAVGRALDRAIASGQAPMELRGALPTLLPERYLESLGWDNLSCLPSIVKRLLVDRTGSDGQVVPQEFRSTVVTLFGHRHQPWFVSLACVAAALFGERVRNGEERNTPLSISILVQEVSEVMKAINGHMPSVEWTGGNIGRLLTEYVDGRFGGSYLEASRIGRVVAYMVGVGAQARLVAGAPFLAKELLPWLLPAPTPPLDLVPLRARAAEQRRHRRALQVEAFMPKFTTLMHVVATRALVFQAFHPLATQARQQFDSGDGTPVPFAMVLSDGSATLRFRVVSAGQLDRESKGDTWKARKCLTGHVLTEYLGASGADGESLPDPFFVSLHRMLYASEESRPVHLRNLPRGVVRPARRVSKFCHEQRRDDATAGRPVRTLLDADALCIGIAYGALSVLVALSTGLRVHELQQLRIDDGYSGLEEDGSVRFIVYPKGYKRSRKSPVDHDISPQIYPYLFEAMRLHEHLWPGWMIGRPHRAAEFGLDPGLYVFFGQRSPFTQMAMNALGQVVALGGNPYIADNEPVRLTTHLLRHGYAHARVELRHSLADIQYGLGHQSRRMTQVYTGDLSVTRPHYLTRTAGVTTQWDAMQASLPEEQ